MLSFDAIAQRLIHRLGQTALTLRPAGGHPWIGLPADRWADAALFLREDPDLAFSLLRCITGLDYPDKRQLAAAYELLSFDHGHSVCIKIFVPRDKPLIPSVAHVWRAADWHEREAYDLLGIRFTGHPDSVTDQAGGHPRRIVLPEDWAGHPLRKDYAFPREYQGIPGSVEVDWAQKPDYPR